MKHIADSLRPLAVETAALTPDPANARQHSERNLEAIRASLARFGQRKPLVVQRRGRALVVRAGNGTLAAALRLGWSHVAAVVVEESDVSATGYAIADIRTGELASWDHGTLEATLNSLATEGVDLDELAFSASDLDEIAAEAHAALGLADAPTADEDGAPPDVDDADVVTLRGDVWLLGRHRLMCGDSTSAQDRATLFAGERFDVLFTSPPYLSQRSYGGDLEGVSWDDLMDGVFLRLAPHASDTAQILVNLGIVHQKSEWADYWRSWCDRMSSEGWRRFGWYVWDQGVGLPGKWSGRLAPSHEFVFHFTRKGVAALKVEKCKMAGKKRPKNQTIRKGDELEPIAYVGDTYGEYKVRDSVARVARAHNSEEADVRSHTARFSVGIAAYFVESWPGQNVYEPFSDSGTTIIAAEQLGRTCFAMEIHPPYVEIAVRRWERLTGGTAERLPGGAL